jgi:4-methylaminobutanoate oxidase (formaldehyde-forming)
MRLEKGYRVWAADITPDETPVEAGLEFCVRKDKWFIGSDALSDGKPNRRLRCLVLDDPRSVALGNEPVRIGEEVCGRVTSGGYGYTVGRSIAYGYLPASVEVGAVVEVDIFGRWVSGEVAPEPLFDVQGERVRRRIGLAEGSPVPTP